MFRILDMDNLISRVELICAEISTSSISGQTALVEASGASKSVVNQWLNGKIKSIDIRFALEIERKLGYSHIWLMTGEGEHKVASGASVVYVDRIVPQPPTYSWISDWEAELISLARTTDERSRERLMDEARSSPRVIRPGIAKN